MMRVIIINRLQSRTYQEMFDSNHVHKRYPQTSQRFSHINLSSSLDNKYLPVISPFTPNTRNTRHLQPALPLYSNFPESIKDGSSTCPIQTGINSITIYSQKNKSGYQNEETSLSNSQNCNEWLQKNYARIKQNISKDRKQGTFHYLKLNGNRKHQNIGIFNKNNECEEDKCKLNQIRPSETQNHTINQNHHSRQLSMTQVSEADGTNKSQSRYQSLNNNKINIQTGLNYLNSNYGVGTPKSKINTNSNSVNASIHLHYFKKSKLQKTTLQRQDSNNQPFPVSSSAFCKDSSQIQLLPLNEPLPSTVPIMETNSCQPVKHLAFYAQSYKGRRPYNEDRYVCETKGNTSLRNKFMNISSKIQYSSQNYYNANGLVQRQSKLTCENTQSSLSSKYSLFGVFDGHGGSKCSQFIKENLSHMLSVNKNLFLSPTEALRQTFQKLEQKFISLCQKRGHLETSGSCAVVCLVNESDCRAILVGPQSVLQVTKDHKPDDRQEKARIIRNGGKLYKDGSVLGIEGKENIKIFNQTRIIPGNLNVSRTFGDIQAKLKKFGGLPGTIISEPDIFTHELSRDYPYLILASDGLFEGLTNQQVHTLYKSLSINQAVKNGSSDITTILTKQLIKKSSQKSNDNITVICVRLPSP